MLTGKSRLTNPILGNGTDGIVWRTKQRTAIKAFYLEKNYSNELECYYRLKESKITEINGLAVPMLEGFNDELMIVEMSIVQRPYLLDFGKVYIDEFPPYQHDSDLLSQWHEELRELFENDVGAVYAILDKLKELGIYYVDPKPANIRF